MQFLPVAARFHCIHHNILRSHKRQLCHQALFNYLRINYQAIHHIQAKIQDTVNRQETFRNREPLIRRIIQRPLKPLRRRCNRRI